MSKTRNILPKKISRNCLKQLQKYFRYLNQNFFLLPCLWCCKCREFRFRCSELSLGTPRNSERFARKLFQSLSRRNRSTGRGWFFRLAGRILPAIKVSRLRFSVGDVSSRPCCRHPCRRCNRTLCNLRPWWLWPCCCTPGCACASCREPVGRDFYQHATDLKGIIADHKIIFLGRIGLPIAAESMWNLSLKFCCFTVSIITASAIGERQMLPRQIIKIPFLSDIANSYNLLGNISKCSCTNNQNNKRSSVRRKQKFFEIFRADKIKLIS